MSTDWEPRARRIADGHTATAAHIAAEHLKRALDELDRFRAERARDVEVVAVAQYVVSAEQAVSPDTADIEHNRRPYEPGFHPQCYPLCLRCSLDALAAAVRARELAGAPTPDTTEES